jgi:hypothetical protein
VSHEDSCPNGSPHYASNVTRELALTTKIMEVIDRYNRAEANTPCPTCLRDTMLAIAALLHLEAEKLHAQKSGTVPLAIKSSTQQFALAAAERLQEVVEANAATVSRRKQ